LQWALREILGDHVHQAGSEVTPDQLRFDFTHPTAMAPMEIARVEQMVNDCILEEHDVGVATMPIEEAREAGAMALFGEKYADEVRVVSIGDFSKELCGGTHIDRVSRIGLFKIVSESAVAAGVRRITAKTGRGALYYVFQREDLLNFVLHRLKAKPDKESLEAKLDAKDRQIKDLKNELAQARSLTKRGGLDDVLEKAEDVDGVPVVVSQVEGADAGALREACDAARAKLPSVLIVLASCEGGKVNLVGAATKDLVEKGIHAGNLIRDVAKAVGGGGGGRPDFGQAGGKNADAVPGALAKVPDLVREQLAAAD